MAQHFLRRAESRKLPLAKVLRMTEEQAYRWFRRARWPETGGEPWCPRCGLLEPWEIRRRRFKCRDKDCRCEFSVTSGSIYASHKLSFRQLIGVIAFAANSVKGKAALQVTRELGVQYKTARANLTKLREAIAAERERLLLTDTVEIDGMYIGGYVRPKNRAQDRVDRRLAENRSQKRRCVIALRQRNSRIVTVITRGEDAAVVTPFVRRYVAQGATLVADEHRAYDPLHAAFDKVDRVNHSLAYRGEDGTSTNQVESFFSRVRRSENGIHHHMASQYLDWYAADLAWREDHRKMGNDRMVVEMLRKALGHPVSRWLCGYWQGNHPPKDPSWSSHDDMIYNMIDLTFGLGVISWII
jgi:hypothetical protein